MLDIYWLPSWPVKLNLYILMFSASHIVVDAYPISIYILCICKKMYAFMYKIIKT